MKPAFKLLAHNYSSSNTVAKRELFEEIGWDDLIDNPGYDNTCAIRVSLALIKSGVALPGRIAIKKGPFAGARIETGQGKLSHMLTTPGFLGKPETFAGGAAEDGIGARQGSLSFWRIPDYLNGNGGHIDIVWPGADGGDMCGSGCYWNSAEVWFWELA
ncbi:MAG TPA: hypothetical protein DCW29_07995 [Janthinobacterium sp.]|nr:hypothetical protein [Janthinobacterium sp.]